MLLAAAEATGLVRTLTEGVEPAEGETVAARLRDSRDTTRQQLVLTLLFMNVLEMRRTWDLRTYSGDGLALLSGRVRAYGYAHAERFLAQLAQSGGAERWTDRLAQWTHQLWTLQRTSGLFYVDGHRKAVYSDRLLPRGLVGRLGKVLGCRALTLLMDGQGHPLLVLTARGDQHLTKGLPAVVARYEQVVGQGQLTQIIVDREGMSAAFLNELSAERTVITLLRADQYQGLESFSHVGEFVPIEYDRDGTLVREVAPAQISLSVPEQPQTWLPLSVALVRDWRRQVPVALESADARAWDDDLGLDQRWWDGDWVATPAPPVPAQPKLIAVVSTASTSDAVELAETYFQRWTAQENIIWDFLLPLGLDINHGYTKTPVENSEVTKRRSVLQKRLDNCQVWAAQAYRKHEWNAQRGERLWQQARAYSKAEYQRLKLYRVELDQQPMAEAQRRSLVKHEQAAIDTELEQRYQQASRVCQRSDQEWRKYERYCAQQRELLRDLANGENDSNSHNHVMSPCRKLCEFLFISP